MKNPALIVLPVQFAKLTLTITANVINTKTGMSFGIISLNIDYVGTASYQVINGGNVLKNTHVNWAVGEGINMLQFFVGNFIYMSQGFLIVIPVSS